MNTRARCMINAEVTKLFVSSKKVALLLVNHQLLLYTSHRHKISVTSVLSLSNKYPKQYSISDSFKLLMVLYKCFTYLLTNCKHRLHFYNITTNKSYYLNEWKNSLPISPSSSKRIDVHTKWIYANR